MFTRLAVACFALYCVHGAQNTARDANALASQGAAMAREAGAEAPRAALRYCLDNAALCARAAEAAAPASLPVPVAVDYPLPPRRPALHKKA